MRKRALSLLLVLLMVFSLLPVSTFADDSVTRVEWLQKLIATFDMTVEEDNYPDNYFSDISSEDEFYRDIMVATNFGFVDTEPGEAFEPNKPATREFAAHTLSFALGFQLDEGTAYTFSDTDAVSYADDAQVAINRGWFKLVDGKFSPTAAITAAESEAMIADAETVLQGEEIEIGHDDVFTYAEGVTEIPRSAGAKLLDDGRLSLKGYTGTLGAGDIIAVYLGVFPTIYKVESIAEDGITVTELESDGYITAMNAEGSADANLADTVGVDDSVVTYVFADGTETLDQKLAQSSSVPVEDVNLSKTIDLGEGIKLNLSGRLSNLKFTYKFKVEASGVELLAKINGNANFGCNLSADFLKAESLPKSVNLCTIPIKGVAEFKVNAVFDLTGEANAQLTVNFMGGFEYKDGIRLLHNFKAESFTLGAQVDAKAGLKAEAGLKNIPLVSGKVWLELGAKAKLIAAVHSGLTPEKCLDVSAHIYAVTGYECGVNALFFSKSWKDSYTIWDFNNSPYRIHNHWEDGASVWPCTYGMTEGYGQYGYITSSDSQYYNNGGSSQTAVVYTYSLDEHNNATITGYNGRASSLTLPKTLDGYPVVAVGSRAFISNNALRYLTIPEGVTEIGSEAFCGCTNLAHVNLPDSLEKIGTYAFYWCDSLTEVNLPPKLRYICTYSFGYCKNLQRVFIPSSIEEVYTNGYGTDPGPFAACPALMQVSFEEGTTEIPYKLFDGCTGLRSITIPDTVTYIGGAAFRNCTNLEYVNFSQNLETISSFAFEGCTSLKEAILPISLKTLDIGAFLDCSGMQKVFIPANVTANWFSSSYYVRDAYVFQGCKSITDVSFEEGIKTIPDTILAGCTGLVSITIPDTVAEIGRGAFLGCTGLTSVTIPNSVTKIGSRAFYGCSALESAELGNSVTEIGESAFYYCTSLADVNFPALLTDIYDLAFCGCTSLTQIDLPKSLRYIGSSAFSGCNGLTEVVLPTKLKELGSSAFGSCENLKSVFIPASLNVGSSGPFYKSPSLTDVTFEEGITQIVSGLFADCTGLRSITIPDTVTSISSEAFKSAENLESITLPAGITSIGKSTFEGCTALKSVDIPAGVTSLSGGLFRSCTALESVAVPAGVTEVKEEAFKDCAALKSIELPDGVNYMGENAFYGCSSLQSFHIPQSVTNIRVGTFSKCSSLESITIPRNVTIIGYDWTNSGVFEDCFALKNVIISQGVEKIGAYAFRSCTSLESITIPKSVTNIYDRAFTGCGSLKDVYYIGTQEEWEAISIGEYGNDCFDIATIHYNGEGHSHEYIAETTAPTCAEKGCTTHVCACGESYVDSYVDALGHDTELVGAKAASCTMAGYTGDEVCKTCGETINEGSVINALGHDSEIKNAVNATETEAGYTGDEICKVCGETLRTGEVIPAVGEQHVHEYVEVVVEPTCTTAGGTVYRCSCGDISDWFIVDALGHDTELVGAKAATCTEAGYTGDEVCKTCGETVYNGAATAALGHSYKDGVCTVCGEADPDYQPPHIHSYTDVVTAPTCTAQGYTTHSCDCGESYVDSYVDALGHDTELKNVKSASCTEAGYSGDEVCTVCGETVKKGAKLDPLGHSYKDGVCTVCGEKETLPGDINGDGAVNVLDLIRLKKYFAGADVELVGSADLNGDGAVNVLDLIRLKKFLAGANVELK